MSTRFRSRIALAAIAVTGAMIAVWAAPAGAATPGVAVGLTHISPELDGGFPCGLGTIPPLNAISAYLNSFQSTAYECNGLIYPGNPPLGNQVAFAGSGVDTAGTVFSIAGSGKLTTPPDPSDPTKLLSYTYEEPCQDNPANPEDRVPATGEAQGFLTLNLTTGGGVVNNQQITASADNPVKITVEFWWSRVGVTAIVGLKGAKITQGETPLVDSPNATGYAPAFFDESVDKLLAGCEPGQVPMPADIQITAGTLSMTS